MRRLPGLLLLHLLLLAGVIIILGFLVTLVVLSPHQILNIFSIFLFLIRPSHLLQGLQLFNTTLVLLLVEGHNPTNLDAHLHLCGVHIAGGLHATRLRLGLPPLAACLASSCFVRAVAYKTPPPLLDRIVARHGLPRRSPTGS